MLTLLVSAIETLDHNRVLIKSSGDYTVFTLKVSDLRLKDGLRASCQVLHSGSETVSSGWSPSPSRRWETENRMN